METPRQRTVTVNPTLAISIVVKPDGPKAIALGAVDTGNMNAYEQTCGSFQHRKCDNRSKKLGRFIIVENYFQSENDLALKNFRLEIRLMKLRPVAILTNILLQAFAPISN